MNTLLTKESFYVIETPTPRILIDPDLKLFYQRAQKYLAVGIQAGELSTWLDLDEELVRLNLDYLQELGFVRLADEEETAAIQERNHGDEIYDENTKFLTKAEALPGTGILIAGYAYYFWFS